MEKVSLEELFKRTGQGSSQVPPKGSSAGVVLAFAIIGPIVGSLVGLTVAAGVITYRIVVGLVF